MGHDGTQAGLAPGKTWARMPNGTKVRHRVEGYEGSIDGVTEIVAKGSTLNPDRRTQYRIYVGAPQRRLAAEDDLLIVADKDGVMMMEKQKVEYRREVTKRFRSLFTDEKFVS